MSDKVPIKNCRPFTMIHNDFLDYEGLNSKEKLVMIMLMRYDGTTFPSIPKLSKKIGLSERTVRYAIKSLEEKNFISRQPRFTDDGGQMSNSYDITDNPKVWKSETSDELSEAISKQELEEMVQMLRSAGYIIQKPAEETDLSDTISDTISDTASKIKEHPMSPNLSELSSKKIDDSTFSNTVKSKMQTSPTIKEKSEKYSMNYLYQYFNYDLICSFKNPYGGLNFRENKHDQEVLDTVFSVLYDMLNDPNPYISIGHESISQTLVTNALLNLTFDAIIGVIDAYNKLDTIYDPVNWLRVALYKANESHNTDSPLPEENSES